MIDLKISHVLLAQSDLLLDFRAEILHFYPGRSKHLCRTINAPNFNAGFSDRE